MGQKISRKKVPETLDKGGMHVIYLHRETGVRPAVFDTRLVIVENIYQQHNSLCIRTIGGVIVAFPQIFHKLINQNYYLMTRATLEAAVQQAATARKYLFRSVPPEYASALVTRYPVALLLPIRFLAIEGRTRGKITYAVTLHLIHRAAKLSPEQRLSLMYSIENDALDIFAAMSANDAVVAVEDLRISPASRPITAQGEVAMTATARVTLCFNNTEE